MPRELITIQIGQCGLQIGCRFWDLILQEHSVYNKIKKNSLPLFNEPMSAFFRNVDNRCPDIEIPIDDGRTPISSLKARSVLIDMEEGVINSLLRGTLGEIFDNRLLIKDVSGSGNNWAQGYSEYGPKHNEQMMEIIWRAAEACDSLQCFLFLHSLGGGTGSGVGSYLLERLYVVYFHHITMM
eukprot:GHVR01107296.1.p1 GENE.GHVR01107296.1~~GHVR01107296.1.p1  ORF type:complete len:183 (-),score=32.49 GHVR01107296.1:290-838(-)